MKHLYFLLLLFGFLSCSSSQGKKSNESSKTTDNQSITETSLVILGTVQDGGSPHIGCKKDCCKALFTNPDASRKVVSLGVIDPRNNKKYIFEATPDFTAQAKILKGFAAPDSKETPDGIFLTHAHIGHYTGLMYLGKEAMNADQVPVFALPRMKKFLETSGPWEQLVTKKNIVLQEMTAEKLVTLSSNLSVLPYTVPHRDEYSETAGYTIIGPNKKALFIPDIDKWQKWSKNIVDEISKVDYAFIDATFYDAEEINNRNIAEIPHPFIIESMSLFANLSAAEKKKIYFIHFNHTNPALNPESEKAKQIIKNGFNIARINEVVKM
jgi:pyrroloquinoline quinone biosynthesis protein B